VSLYNHSLTQMTDTTRQSLVNLTESLYLSDAVVSWADVVSTLLKSRSMGDISSYLFAHYSEEDLAGLRRLIGLYDKLPATSSSVLDSNLHMDQENQQIMLFCISREISTDVDLHLQTWICLLSNIDVSML